MINVLKAGMSTTVQDLGRWGYQAFGIPVSGAMDAYACQVANLLVGNQTNAAVLEMTISGGEYEFKQSTLIALAGADMEAQLNGNPVPIWSSISVQAGDVLTCSFVRSGCRTYLAVAGGLDVPLVLNSRSTHTRSKLGGYEGRTLQAGDTLPLGTPLQHYTPVQLPAQFIPSYHSEIQVRVLLGPQQEYFTAKGIATIFNNIYTITAEADRMGYRLEGAQIEHLHGADIISDALCQGAIQVPAHGMPIVMMADRQTTGGYTKIGAVITADLSRMAQAKPGDRIQFVQTEDTEAVLALQQEQQLLSDLQDFLQQKMLANTKNYLITVNGTAYNVTVQEK